MNRSYLHLCGLCLSMTTMTSFAGIIADSTRLIFPEDKREVSMRLNNTNNYPIMTQIWVDHGVGNPDTAQAPFLVLNPMFKMLPSENTSIRIMITDTTELANDRESLFWLNLYEIPSVEAKNLDKDYINMSMNTQLKVIYRPKNVPTPNFNELKKQLKFSLLNQNGTALLSIENSSQHYISMVNLQLINQNGARFKPVDGDSMIQPQSTKTYRFIGFNSIATNTQLELRIIDDLGHHQQFKKQL